MWHLLATLDVCFTNELVPPNACLNEGKGHWEEVAGSWRAVCAPTVWHGQDVRMSCGTSGRWDVTGPPSDFYSVPPKRVGCGARGG